MAEAEVATKAPESDVQETSVATEEAPTEEAPTETTPAMGEHCTTDRPTRESPFLRRINHVRP